MNYEELTDEQKDMIKQSKTPEEILAIANEQGYALTDDELEAISGGERTWILHEHVGS